jgi:hypothetical protein
MVPQCENGAGWEEFGPGKSAKGTVHTEDHHKGLAQL